MACRRHAHNYPKIEQNHVEEDTLAETKMEYGVKVVKRSFAVGQQLEGLALHHADQLDGR